MIGSKKKSLKEDIVELLVDNQMSSKRILTSLKSTGYDVTIQAVYKQLKILLNEEVVLKNKKEYFVSNEWKRSLITLLSDQDFIFPNEGEKFTYKFNSLVHLDAHWKHITDAIMNRNKNSSVLSYCPHQIWPYVPTRMLSEQNVVQIHEKTNKYNYFIVGGKTELDKKYRRLFNKTYYKVQLITDFDKRENVHVTIIDDILVWSFINKDIAEKIDVIYNNNQTPTQQVQELVAILGQDQNCKIIIERKKKKADMYKKRFAQIFAKIY